MRRASAATRRLLAALLALLLSLAANAYSPFHRDRQQAYNRGAVVPSALTGCFGARAPSRLTAAG